MSTPNAPAPAPAAGGPRAGERTAADVYMEGFVACYPALADTWAKREVRAAFFAGLAHVGGELARLRAENERLAKVLKLLRDNARLMPTPRLGAINWPMLADQADAALAGRGPGEPAT